MALPHHPAAAEEGDKEHHRSSQDEQCAEHYDLAPRCILERSCLGVDDEAEEANAETQELESRENWPN